MTMPYSLLHVQFVDMFQKVPAGFGASLRCACDTPRRLASGGLCLDRNASTLRELGSWKEWIKTIRSYGESASDLLSGKSDALLLAQAMEDNGCGFLSNLSAQNISLGGCFSWDNRFTWEFKTLEFFCPITCGCSSDNSQRSGCPEPFGKSCDQLSRSRCLTWNDQHFCPGFNTEIIYALMMYDYSSPDVMHFARTSVSCVFFNLIHVYGLVVPIEVKRKVTRTWNHDNQQAPPGWLGHVWYGVFRCFSCRSKSFRKECQQRSRSFGLP